MKNNFMKIYFFILFLIFINSFSLFSYTDSLCGIKSLLVIYKHYGIKPDFKEISNLIRKYPNGMSMYQLYKILNNKGLYAYGVKISLKEISELNTPVIAYFYPNHFAVIESFKNGKFKIIDLPNIYYLTEKEISGYSGFSLLVFSDKNSFTKLKRDGPDIRFDRYVYNLGNIKPDSKISISFRFKNIGNKPLIIKNVRASCGCIVSKLEKKFYLPGERGKIKVTFDTKGRAGIQKESIYINSNDPVTPIILLTIEGIIPISFTYFPHFIDLWKIRKGEIVKREIFLIGEESRLKIKKILVPEKFKIEQEKIKNGYKLTLTFQPEEIKNVKEKLVIYTNIKSNRKIEIPVEGEVKGEIEIFPEFLFFGIVRKGENLTRSVKISHHYHKNFNIEKMYNNMSWISLNLKKEKRGYILTAKINREIPEGIIKEKILLQTNLKSEPFLEIPVYIWARR